MRRLMLNGFAAFAWCAACLPAHAAASPRINEVLAANTASIEDEDGDFHWGELLLSDDNTPETEHLRQVFWDELFIALQELPENQRNVFVWNELEDQTFQQIADRTGENIKTLISRKRYAVQHLRRRLESLYNELNDL